MESSFSCWYHWTARGEYPGIAYPGIYVVSISSKDISGQAFTFRDEIVYVGMTNAVSGLRGRLTQFDNTVARRHCQHGGADRVLYKHQDYAALAESLYVALRHFKCDPTENTPSDLPAMGRVACTEYECMACCIEKFGRLPEFNRKKDSPKFSLTFGRS